MVAMILSTYALIAGILFITVFRSEFSRSSNRTVFLLILLFAVGYDNCVQAFGPVALNSTVYLYLNYFRFILHVTVLPFLVLFTLSVLRAANINSAKKNGLAIACWLFVVTAIVYGYWHEIASLTLVTTDVLGHAKMVKQMPSLPLATIACNLVVLGMATLLWLSTGWRWLAAGSLFILVVNGLAATVAWGFLLGNLAELVFITSLLLAHRQFSRLSTA